MKCPKCNEEIGIMKAIVDGVEHCIHCVMPPKESVETEAKDFDFSIFTKEQQVVLKKIDETILDEATDLTDYNEVLETVVKHAIQLVNDELEDYVDSYNDENGTRIEIDLLDSYKFDIDNKNVFIKLSASKKKLLKELDYEVDVEFNNLTDFNLSFK